MSKWLISVRTHTSRRDFFIYSDPEEKILDTYKRVKVKAQLIRDQFVGKNVTVDVVSRTLAFKKPDSVTVGKGHLWCPYCIKPRIFMEDQKMGVDRCPICGVSVNEFYVSKYNKLRRNL